MSANDAQFPVPQHSAITNLYISKMRAEVAMNSMICCLVPRLSWPCFVLSDIAPAWEAGFHLGSKE